MKKRIPLTATLLITGVCISWTALSLDDDKRDRPRDDKPDRPRADDRLRDGDRDRPRVGDRVPHREHGDRERDVHGQAHELEAWLEKREKQINNLRKQGKADQAEALAQRTRKELEQHRRAIANRKRDKPAHREHGHGDDGDNDEFGKWVDQQERRIAELREAGKKDEAARALKHLHDAIAKFRGQGEHREHEHRRADRDEDHDVRQFLEQAERKIQQLRKQGKHKEAEDLLRHVRAELAERRKHGEGHDRGHDERGHREGGNEKRMEHIGAAIKHLQAAGLHDWAEELAAHARKLHGKRENLHERDDHPDPGHRREGHDQEHRPGIDQLRREVNEIRNILRELQKHLRERHERE